MQIEHDRQMNLSTTSREKGSREWSLFNAVAHDHVDAYRVLTPRKRDELRYHNILHINRYPRQLTVRFAR